MSTVLLDELAYKWKEYKRLEEEANKERLEVEKTILSYIEGKEEGTVTKKTNYYKISVIYGIDRKVDSEIASSLSSELGDEYERIFKWEAKIDIKEMRFLVEKKPDVYALVAKAMTSKPKKPSFKIDEVAE